MKYLSILGAMVACTFCGQLDAAQEVQSLNELNQIIKNSNKPVYVDCYSKGCPPCRKLGPVFEKVSNEKANKGTFVKLSLDKTYEAVKVYDIQGMPTLLIFDKNGKLKDKIVGFGPINAFLKTL